MMKSRLLLLLFALVLGVVAVRHGADLLAAADRLAEQRSPSALPAADLAGADADGDAAGRLYSPHAILVSLDDRRVLMDKGADERVYPASLTKIMTALVAIERLPDLQATASLSPAMFERLRKANASMAGFLPGEEVRAIDLLYGAMLPSGADASVGLAQRVAGSEKKFAALMNKKAKALGMKHTHFTNATGLHDPDHYTTVRDLSLLLASALQNDTFRRLFTTSRYTTAPTALHPDGITLYSTMFKELDTPRFDGGEILGGKTGYTEKAGLCLASLARKDGKEYMLITAGAKGNHDTDAYNVADALAVYAQLGKAL